MSKKVFRERRDKETKEEKERLAHEGGYVLWLAVAMILFFILWAALTGTLKP